MPCCGAAKRQQQFKAKDGTRVMILPAGKQSGRADAESRIEFYSPQNQFLCALDYSSEDSEHGFGVVKAAWTRDNNYFVFSLTSSGGHQPWHSPTLFYTIGDNAIRSLDDYVQAPGISNGDFTLQYPNVVLTQALQGEKSVPVILHLDSMRAHKPQDVLRCAEGAVIKPESGEKKPNA